MDANVSFTGNLGTDVEMKIGEGWRGARFRVAHTPRVMRQGEWVDGTTTWMSVHVYGRLADNCHVSLRKGDPVMVTGRLRTRSWIDVRAPTSNSLSLHIMLDRTYPGCLPRVVDPRNAPKLPWAMIG